ncbi:uncharacterized protein DUF4274 [Flavobacterium sp. 90]|uniref:DUF4274 domain-containing protein n=1 Tax=unclassified Flavobacterium TaxID=196869 RepID=UPI000EAC207A|nr:MULTISPECIES: DUF4274 domain-containing protein [unclassified Flavobacterium]RKR09168.1 uncharacterized protein DUF4274 [Flavobacterium sp. 81]TCK52952.1 uncharacterized protein DUF4274 [Flavobacterium sp. 90]
MEELFNKKSKNRVLKAVNSEMSYQKLTAPELHQFVQNWNYDDGIEPFEWIIKQKHLDKGTALCLYWMLQPDYFCRFETEDEIKEDINFETYQIVKEIEQRYVSGFYADENFSFDPREEFLNEYSNAKCIPAEMLVKSPGIAFDRQDIEFAFLRKPNEKELKTINTKIADAIKTIQISNPDFVYDQTENTIKAIIESVEYWKEKELGKIKINNLSYLWMDAVQKTHNWDWTIWDWETGNNIGITNTTKELTCLSDTIIKHTIDGFQESSIMIDLYHDLAGANNFYDLKRDPYSGIGLLFSTDHLKFRE